MLLRRKKNVVLKGLLPELKEHKVYVELSHEERLEYTKIETEFKEYP